MLRVAIGKLLQFALNELTPPPPSRGEQRPASITIFAADKPVEGADRA